MIYDYDLRMSDESSEAKQREEEVEQFLKDLGFELIIHDIIVKEENKQIGQIDSLFEYNNRMFIIEVSTKKKLDNMKKNYFFSKWSDAYNLGRLRKQCKLKTMKTFRIYFDMVTDTPENHEGLDHITKRQKGNKIVYLNMYKRLVADLKKNKSSTRTRFIKWVESTDDLHTIL